MGAICTACRHPQTEAISLALIQKVPMREIAEKYGLSLSAVARHKKHIPAQLAKADEAHHVAEAGSVMQRIMELDKRADEIYRQATSDQDHNLALKALKELREVTTLYAKLAGEISTGGTVNNIIVTPEWVSMRAVMLHALEPYPDARRALVMALGGMQNAALPG